MVLRRDVIRHNQMCLLGPPIFISTCHFVWRKPSIFLGHFAPLVLNHVGPFSYLLRCWWFVNIRILMMLNTIPVQHQPTWGLDALGTTFFGVSFLKSCSYSPWSHSGKGKFYCQSDVVPIKMRQGTGIFHLQLIPSGNLT